MSAVDESRELQERTKLFAVRVVGMFRALPKAAEAKIVGRQVLRSGTSVAANYRAASRARSKADFVSKLGIVLEEADETEFWLEMLVACGCVAEKRLENLLREANELVKIFGKAWHTARTNLDRGRSDPIDRSSDRPIDR